MANKKRKVGEEYPAIPWKKDAGPRSQDSDIISRLVVRSQSSRIIDRNLQNISSSTVKTVNMAPYLARLPTERLPSTLLFLVLLASTCMQGKEIDACALVHAVGEDSAIVVNHVFIGCRVGHIVIGRPMSLRWLSLGCLGSGSRHFLW